MAFSRPRMSLASSLREVINSTRHSEMLGSIPDRLATIFQNYDDPRLSTVFRQDIYQLLSSACAVAEALSDDTYPGDAAQVEAGHILQVIARLNSHLASRPALEGFAIMFPATGVVMPQFFKNHIEATQHLESLRSMGVSQQCIVIPAKLTSHNVIQPKHRAIPPPIPTNSSEVLVENPPMADSERIASEAAKISDAYSNSGEVKETT